MTHGVELPIDTTICGARVRLDLAPRDRVSTMRKRVTCLGCQILMDEEKMDEEPEILSVPVICCKRCGALSSRDGALPVCCDGQPRTWVITWPGAEDYKSP